MTQLLNDDFDKIQGMIEKLIVKQEKEADRRFVELTKQIENFNARYNEGAKFYFEDRAALEEKIGKRIDVVDRKIDVLDDKFDIYKTEVDKRTSSGLVEIIRILTGALLGGGLYSILQHTGVIH